MRRILVAEDDSALRSLYRSWLGNAGYEVTAAADGREAIAAVALGGSPEAAILDVDMPYVDGLSVCRYLRLRDGSIPIVVATGMEDVREEALAAGATAVLGKPCTRDDLLGALADAAERVRRDRFAQRLHAS
jgi:CheY-like chemotaxis protein